MKIYTKKGDAGTTKTFSGKTFRKNDTTISCGGCADEAITQIEKCSVLLFDKFSNEFPAMNKDLQKIIQALYQLMAEISNGKASGLARTLDQGYVVRLERRIDEITSELPKQTQFTFYKTLLGVEISESRVRVRRLEREMVDMLRHNVIRPVLFQYVNRLSDYLYILSVWAEREVLKE